MNASEMIYDSLKSLHEKMDDVKERLIKVEMNSDQNTKDLTEHIEGVKQTRVLIDQHEARDNAIFKELNKRVEVLEEPKKVKAYLTKSLLWLGGLSTSIFSIYRLYLYIKEHLPF
jgi:hypothetical protein